MDDEGMPIWLKAVLVLSVVVIVLALIWAGSGEMP